MISLFTVVFIYTPARLCTLSSGPVPCLVFRAVLSCRWKSFLTRIQLHFQFHLLITLSVRSLLLSPRPRVRLIAYMARWTTSINFQFRSQVVKIKTHCFRSQNGTQKKHNKKQKSKPKTLGAVGDTSRKSTTVTRQVARPYEKLLGNWTIFGQKLQ